MYFLMLMLSTQRIQSTLNTLMLSEKWFLGPEDDVKELQLVNALLPRSVILALGARHVETVSNVSL